MTTHLPTGEHKKTEVATESKEAIDPTDPIEVTEAASEVDGSMTEMVAMAASEVEIEAVTDHRSERGVLPETSRVAASKTETEDPTTETVGMADSEAAERWVRTDSAT